MCGREVAPLRCYVTRGAVFDVCRAGSVATTRYRYADAVLVLTDGVTGSSELHERRTQLKIAKDGTAGLVYGHGGARVQLGGEQIDRELSWDAELRGPCLP